MINLSFSNSCPFCNKSIDDDDAFLGHRCLNNYEVSICVTHNIIDFIIIANDKYYIATDYIQKYIEICRLDTRKSIKIDKLMDVNPINFIKIINLLVFS